MTQPPAAAGPVSLRLRCAFAGLFAQALGGFALGWVVRRLTPRRYVAPPSWDPLPGPFPVGVRDIDMHDPRRPEPEHPRAMRTLTARIWYPAQSGAVARRRFHAPDEAAWLSAKSPRVLAGRIHELGTVETWSGQDAAAFAGATRFPVLLFSHGLGGVVSQNTHLCERLASRGYLVVSLAHPYGGASVRFADGSEALMTPEISRRKFDFKALRFPSLAVRSARTWAAAVTAAEALLSLPGFRPELKIWAEDTGSALDALMAGATVPSIQDVLALADFSRVGAFGMSFGGAASAAAAHRDARINAAINLDGNQFGTELWDTTIRVPLLELRSEDARIGTGGGFNDLHYERFVDAGTSGIVWRYLVRGSRHPDFTDLTLLGNRLLRRLMGHGPVQGARMNALVLDLVGRFFDRFLKGDLTAWPAEAICDWPELKAIDTAGLRTWARERGEIR